MNDRMRCIASGTKGDDESWVSWWLLPCHADVDEFCDQHDISRHDGDPGSICLRKPVIRRSKSYVLITQLGCLDI